MLSYAFPCFSLLSLVFPCLPCMLLTKKCGICFFLLSLCWAFRHLVLHACTTQTHDRSSRSHAKTGSNTPDPKGSVDFPLVLSRCCCWSCFCRFCFCCCPCLYYRPCGNNDEGSSRSRSRSSSSRSSSSSSSASMSISFEFQRHSKLFDAISSPE